MQRILGCLVVFQALAPLLIVLLLLGGVIKLGYDISVVIDSGWNKASQHMSDAGEQILAVRQEGQRLMNEVQKVKGAAKKFAGDIGKAVDPLRKALLGLQSSMKLVAGSLEVVINGIVSAINRIPGIKLRKLNIKRLFNFNAFTIDIPEVDLNISPDFTALKAFAGSADALANDAVQTLNSLKNAFIFWWGIVKWVFILVIFWGLLAVTGYISRMMVKVKKGVRLIKGEQVGEAWQLL